MPPLRVSLPCALTGALATLAVVSLLAVAPPGLGPRASDLVPCASPYVDNYDLAAGVAETVTAPTFLDEPGVRLVALFHFEGTGPVYMRKGGTAVAPTGDVVNGTASFGNPGSLKMDPADTISVLSVGNGDLDIRWYRDRGEDAFSCP
jgi:hypothetical protein